MLVEGIHGVPVLFVLALFAADRLVLLTAAQGFVGRDLIHKLAVRVGRGRVEQHIWSWLQVMRKFVYLCGLILARVGMRAEVFR